MLRCPSCHAYIERDEGITLCPNDGESLLPADAPIEDADAGDSLIGLELVGGVRLTRVAGEGAMGTVYEGWQAGMERRVAVKVLRPDLAHEHGFFERFMREARAIARLSHPNIVTVHTMGETEESPYLVMEFIDGPTVADEIEKGPMPPARAIRITRQIASALADAHAEGIIHRDLKPANILLCQRRRSADFVKLLDFGVAKMVDAGATLTREGFVFGTPAYLSPEQASGSAIDGRSDLYSLGVCLFEMLAHQLPFSGNQVQLLLKHAREEAPPIRSVASSIPVELAALVDQLLSKAPEDRVQNAEALCDRLDDLLGDDAPNPWASRALAPSDLPDRVARDVSHSDAEETRALRPARQRPRRPALLAIAGLLLLCGGAGTATLLLRNYLPVYPVGADFRPHVEVSLPAPSPGDPDINIDLIGPRSATMASQDGFALRVSTPRAPLTDVYYEIHVDVWHPSGEPVIGAEIITEFDEPGLARPFPTTPSETPGRYTLVRRFDRAGDYVMRVYPPQGGSPVEVQFPVITAG